MEIEGRKFSGNSQYAREGRIMHHGTMMFDSQLEMLGKALAVSEDKIRSKGHQSVKSRVTNIRPYLRQDMDTKQFFQVIRDFHRTMRLRKKDGWKAVGISKFI